MNAEPRLPREIGFLLIAAISVGLWVGIAQLARPWIGAVLALGLPI